MGDPRWGPDGIMRQLTQQQLQPQLPPQLPSVSATPEVRARLEVDCSAGNSTCKSSQSLEAIQWVLTAKQGALVAAHTLPTIVLWQLG